MYKVSETVLPIYINGQCPIIKTCSDVTLNLSSKDSNSDHLTMLNAYRVSEGQNMPQDDTTFFMLNLSELEIYPAYEC